MFRILVLLTTALATPAAALSCMRPSVAQTFARLDAAPEAYVIARGILTPLPGEPTEAEGGLNDKAPYEVRARLIGRLATRDGFTRAVEAPVTVEVGCAGPWCGGAPEGEVVAFLRQAGDGFALEAGPCPFAAFPASAEVEREALACLRGEGCAEE